MRTPNSGLVHSSLRAALVGAMLFTAASADARDGRNAAMFGGAALGVLGGVALGAALASPPPPPYRPRPVYVEEVQPVYVAPVRRGPICHYEQRKEWLNSVEFTFRRVQVCE